MTSACQYRVSAKALIKNQRNEFLFVEEKQGNGFELPGGGIENGETASDALIRELKEELNVAPISIAKAPTFVWIINGEVIWLIYEVEIAPMETFSKSIHIASAGFYKVTDLLERASNGLGFCTRLYHEDLQKVYNSFISPG